MSRTLPRSVVLLGLCSLLTDASSEMILPLLPALVLGTMHATPLALGVIDGAADALSAVLKLVAGRLSDRMRRRMPFVLLGYGLSTAVRPLVALAASPVHVLLVRALDRVGKGVRSAPRDALLADAVDEADAPRAFAFHRMMDHAGAVVGPLLASLLLWRGLDVREAIMLAWIPGALAWLTLLFLREPPRPPSGDAAPVDDEPRGVALSRPLRRLVLTCGAFTAAALPDLFLLLRARELGVVDALLPIAWAVLHVAKVLAAAHVARRAWSTPGFVALAWLLVAAGAALLLVPVAWIVWPAALLLGTGHGVREPIEKVLVRAACDVDTRGRAFGQYHLAAGLGALVAGVAWGALWTTAGHAPALTGCAACAALAAVALMAGRNTGRG